MLAVIMILLAQVLLRGKLVMDLSQARNLHSVQLIRKRITLLKKIRIGLEEIKLPQKLQVIDISHQFLMSFSYSQTRKNPD